MCFGRNYEDLEVFFLVQMNRAWVNLSKAPSGSVKNRIHGHADFLFYFMVCHEWYGWDWRGRLNGGVADCCGAVAGWVEAAIACQAVGKFLEID